MGEPARIEVDRFGRVAVEPRPDGKTTLEVTWRGHGGWLALPDAARRRLIEALGGVPAEDLARVGMFVEHEAAVTAVAYSEPFPWPDPREPDAIPIFVRRTDLPEEGRQ